MKHVLVEFDSEENASRWANALAQVCESTQKREPNEACAFVLNLLLSRVVSISIQESDAEPRTDPVRSARFNNLN